MNLPTKITVARICLIPIFVVLYLIDIIYFDIFATVIFIIASCTDFIDGYLARKNNMVTNLGKFLDPIADKMLVVFALVLLCIKIDSDFQIAFAVMSALIISRELIISVFRQVAATKNCVLAADNLGKAKTVVTLIAIPLLMLGEYPFGKVYFFFYAGFVLFVIAFILTVISAFNYVLSNQEILKNGKTVSVKNESQNKSEVNETEISKDNESISKENKPEEKESDKNKVLKGKEKFKDKAVRFTENCATEKVDTENADNSENNEVIENNK